MNFHSDVGDRNNRLYVLARAVAPILQRSTTRVGNAVRISLASR